MTNKEFCYWLQGYFELDGSIESLSEAQLIIIKNHINLVKANDKILGEFTSWLEGAIDISESPTTRAKLTKLAQSKLSSVFEHTIDPSYKEPAALSKLHGPGLIRC